MVLERGWTVRQRVAAAFVAFSAVCVGAGLLIAYLGATLSHLAEVDDGIIERISTLQHRHESSGHEDLILGVAEQMEHESDGTWLYVYWDPATGKVWAGSESLVPLASNLSERPTSYTSGDRFLRGAVVPLAGEKMLGVTRDVTWQVRFEHRLMVWCISVGALLLALAVWVGLWASRKLVGRVEGMSVSVGQLIDGEASTRITVRTPGDEFDELGRRFNELLDENEQLMSQVRQVTNDIAHDLRMPLARIRRYLESVLGRPELPRDVEEVARAALVETDALLDTFQALLSIARIESRAFRKELKAVDLAQTARTAAELYEPAADEAGMRLEVDTEATALVMGDRHLISQALSNLIDNAIKYSPAASTIGVSVHRVRGAIELRVTDQGPGIPAADRARVLEQFVRLDTARATPGTGLGLSLVAAIVRLHGGELTLGDNDPGLAVTIRFMAMNPESPSSTPSPSSETFEQGD